MSGLISTVVELVVMDDSPSELTPHKKKTRGTSEKKSQLVLRELPPLKQNRERKPILVKL